MTFVPEHNLSGDVIVFDANHLERLFVNDTSCIGQIHLMNASVPSVTKLEYTNDALKLLVQSLAQMLDIFCGPLAYIRELTRNGSLWPFWRPLCMRFAHSFPLASSAVLHSSESFIITEDAQML